MHESRPSTPDRCERLSSSAVTIVRERPAGVLGWGGRERLNFTTLPRRDPDDGVWTPGRSSLPAPLQRHDEMTVGAEQPIVAQPALAPAIGHWHDVIRVPARSFPTPDAPRLPVRRRGLPARPAPQEQAHIASASLAAPAVTLPHLFPYVGRIAPQPPLVHARIAAEGAARRPHPRPTPSANGASLRIPVGPAPRVALYRATPDGAHWSRG